MRTSEILIDNLEEWAVKFNKTAGLEDAAYQAGVNLRCEEDKNGKLTWTDLNGCELEKLMKNIDLNTLLESHPHREKIQFLWKTLIELYTALRVPTTSPDYLQPQQFHDKAKVFTRQLRTVYKDWNVTPYIHCLIYHIPQFLEIYGTIYQFNCQLVEKKNQQHTSFFHRSTQKGGLCSSHCRQVMERENRRLFALQHGLCEQTGTTRRHVCNVAVRQAFLQRLQQLREERARRRGAARVRRAAIKKVRAAMTRKAAAAKRKSKSAAGHSR